jgi:F420-dependent oxidoreductase-like protein
MRGMLAGVRFSLWPSSNQPYADVLAVARYADAHDVAGLWFADHFMGSGGSPLTPADLPTLEAGSLVAAMAAATERVRVGTLVYGNTYRHPAVLANMAATVDHISGGRFTLGVGAGWQQNEHDQYGIALPAARERVDRLAEALVVLRGLLTQPTTTVAGAHYQLTDALCEPKPVQARLPILVGASGERRMLGVVARLADQWNCWATPDTFAHKNAVLDRRCEEAGRDPAHIRRTTQALVFLTDDDTRADELLARVPRAAIGGTSSRLVDTLGRYAELGVDEFIVPDFTLGPLPQKLEALDRLASEVFPALG